MLYQYAYFIGGLILAFVWVALGIMRPDLRRKMLFGSILGLPFGFSELLFVPEYWDPPSLFNLITKIGFGVESFMFAFFASGIASVVYEVVGKKKLRKMWLKRKGNTIPYIEIIFSFLILEFLLPTKSIYNLSFSFLLGAFLMWNKRKDLITEILSSGLIFSVIYFLLFLFFNTLFPQYISNIYTLENFWGIALLGVPIEEIVFAFSLGACWSILFEYIKNYKMIDMG